MLVPVSLLFVVVVAAAIFLFIFAFDPAIRPDRRVAWPATATSPIEPRCPGYPLVPGTEFS